MTVGHAAYAGRKPAKEVAGVSGVGTIQCVFCEKKFTTIEAAKMHEASRHKKKLLKIVKGAAE
jgi:hypothetical protein